MSKKYVAEFIGTFALSFVVLTAVSYVGGLPIAIPLIAGLTLALFVYTIGPISGCHINPSVTIAQLSIRKISRADAVGYIVAQLLGALLAVIIAKIFGTTSSMGGASFSVKVFFAEMLGAFFFNFGIASVVYGKAKDQMSGLVVGGSLLFGILVATFSGASGILNPAVALALNSLTAVYLFAPVVGAILGVHAYRLISNESERRNPLKV